ncbi:DUF7500 family protein [Halalkalicoccus jeotgali]|uniref:Uncharacterized protein n=1 Tax=Halalkalicoccus jeotgali (strain DSM 18796 / CECT 7217 / JCM 14584 / KCTC 4019 / B3) TaxID=795797 RepID=D8J2R2_HALJB|nr:hypothetical protein [Halalkalicoccus jeotgali]ADJ15019.1 hypothetical protein HacjB3_08180 [Halalkalicoccus jeotgali B3]ELY34965.1 hypothetical protein C497_14537 [Halalkalicoccus jeotgali B3]
MTDERQNSSDDGVLSPSDLDLADSEYVAEIDDGRYVVSTDRTVPEPSGAETSDDSHRFDSGARYEVVIEGRFDGETSNHRTGSDDVVATFSDLLRWYAREVDDELDPERVLGILVAESDLAIGPRPTVETALDRHDLTPTDSIADLLAALETQR